LRDVVAHMIGWERLTVKRNELIKQGVEPDAISCDDADSINAEFVRTIDTRSKQELLRQFQEVREDLVVSLRSLNEQQYTQDVGRLPSVQKRLAGCTFEHEADHIAKVESWVASREEELDNATGADSKIVMANRALPWLQHPKSKMSASEKSVEMEALQEEIADYPIAVQKIETAAGTEKLVRTSMTPHDNPVPTPPFWGSRVVDDIKLEKVWEYLNEVALFRGQWQIKRGKRTVEEFEKQVEEVARPKLQELKLRAKRDRMLHPKVVYGYFPCWSEGDDLVVLKPSGQADPYGTWGKVAIEDLVEWQRFSFPRQPTARRLCLADFFLPKEEAQRRNQPDVVSFTAVTVGREASRYTAKLFESNQYADYLFIHGLSVETAEALAEYWHKIVRTELGIANKDAKDVTRLFSQGYQGSRYSFGYPACPNLEDQTKLFELIRPERIDVTLTEEYHLEPEQSTTAIITHHPNAKYFSIK
jgi:cobalamin-dependent methionine synthase I